MAKPNRDLHISEDPFSSIVDPSVDNLTLLFKSYREDLICFGHHHPVHFFENGYTTFLNPGSLGCHSQPTARYAIVDIEKDRIKVSLEEAVYDNSDFLASYERMKVPDRGFLIKAFHGDQVLR